MSSIEQTINDAFERRADITPTTVDGETKKAIEKPLILSIQVKLVLRSKKVSVTGLLMNG